MQPNIIPQSEHGILLDQIDKDALYVLEKLRSAGYIAYLVGGSVRDLLLGFKPKDIDISTSAKPEEIKTLFRNCILIGRRFRLAHIRFGKKILEVSTFRSGDIESAMLILRDNEWGTAEEDVTRRDFTINGLFYDSFDQTVIDYVGGFPDIKRRYLRTIGQPYVRFMQDPVRMIRLLKFQARLGFEADPEARQALLECRGEITKSSPARILEELLRMLESGSARNFFQLMTDHGMLQLLLPEISNFLETGDGQQIYQFLQEADLLHQEKEKVYLDRSILLSCIVFPMLEKHISTHLAEKEPKPHLGEIQEHASQLIHHVFSGFFHLPRFLKGKMIAILTSQYRMTPIWPLTKKKIRIPRFSDFPLALRFLKIRSCLEPSLQITWDEWDRAYQKSGQNKERSSRFRKRY